MPLWLQVVIYGVIGIFGFVTEGKSETLEEQLADFKLRLPFSEIVLQQGGASMLWIEGKVASAYQKTRCEQWLKKYHPSAASYLQIKPLDIEINFRFTSIPQTNPHFATILKLLSRTEVRLKYQRPILLYPVDEILWRLVDFIPIYDQVWYQHYKTGEPVQPMVVKNHPQLLFNVEVLTDNLLRWQVFFHDEFQMEFTDHSDQPCRLIWKSITNSQTCLNILNLQFEKLKTDQNM